MWISAQTKQSVLPIGFQEQLQRKLRELEEKQQEGEAGDGGMARLHTSNYLV